MQQRTNPPAAGSTSDDQEAECSGIAVVRRAGHQRLAVDEEPALTACTDSRLVVSFGMHSHSSSTKVDAEDAQRVSAMRRLVRSFLDRCGLPGLMDDAALVVSELITNSLAHSGGADVRMGLRLVGGRFCIEVDDGAADRSPRPLPLPEPDAENGRGLHLVEAVVRARQGTWGVSPDGARTWCSLSATDELEQP
jgi:anti-sigma regulatory factor (Ser/Thr protein kinase)